MWCLCCCEVLFLLKWLNETKIYLLKPIIATMNLIKNQICKMPCIAMYMPHNNYICIFIHTWIIDMSGLRSMPSHHYVVCDNSRHTLRELQLKIDHERQTFLRNFSWKFIDFHKADIWFHPNLSRVCKFRTWLSEL